MKTAIVIGVGPNRGLGAQLCKRFAADGLRVIVAGRTQSAIEAVADDITPSANEGSRSCVAVCPPQASGVGKLDSFGTQMEELAERRGMRTVIDALPKVSGSE
jgi:NAD(P)-dependent dehydrogenase (short-subunit alcohol dehydrogenase family)